MPVSKSISQGGDVLTIAVVGRFDFSLHDEFRRAYRDAEKTPRRYIIDFSRTEYIDSSALGMLLLLRQHAGGDKSDVALLNATQAVRSILTVANFQKMFRIS